MDANRRLLIDSHILIWLLFEPEKITEQTKTVLQAADIVYFSSVSLWELTLKFSKGKLAYQPVELAKGVLELNLERLALRDEHVLATLDIELVHKEPFDALLVAQSVIEGCTLVTADGNILDSTYSTHDAR